MVEFFFGGLNVLHLHHESESESFRVVLLQQPKSLCQSCDKAVFLRTNKATMKVRYSLKAWDVSGLTDFQARNVCNLENTKTKVLQNSCCGSKSLRAARNCETSLKEYAFLEACD
jgi:hypothetical protein